MTCTEFTPQPAQEAVAVLTIPDIDLEKWYTIMQVCRIFDIGQRTLLNWRNEKKISFYKFGRRVRFCKTDIDAALQRYRQAGFL